MNRRRFLTTIAVTAASTQAAGSILGDVPLRPDYRRAHTDWLGKCRYGVGVHWTVQTVPRTGSPLAFQDAVEAFDLKRFLDAVSHAGANYVLFTAAHALQMLPAPHPVLDRLLPGRTCQRDLIDELATGLAARGIPLLVYYNHSCNLQQDRSWEQAVGYHAADKNVLATNLMEIVGWMGERYRDKVRAWWFDSPYSLDPRGPNNSVTTDMTGFRFPWDQFTEAAKQGFAGRLVTYNAGVNETFLYTTHQDYWAGEMVNLETPARARYLDSGLQWFGWTCLDFREWVHTKRDTEIPKPLYTDEAVIDFVRTCNAHGAPMTFNVGIYQDGTLAAPSIEQLHRLGKSLGA